MQVRTLNNWIPKPILLLGAVEFAVLFSSFFAGAAVICGGVANCEQSIAPKALFVASFVIVCLVSMGLYQFNQRIRYREAVLRLVIGVSVGFLVATALYAVMPVDDLKSSVDKIAFAYSLLLLLGVRYYFVRTVDTNVFRRRTLIFGAGERAARLTELRRRADRRGFVIIGRVVAPGDTIVGDHSKVLTTDDKSLLDIAEEEQVDEIVIAMDEKRGNLPVRQLLDARLKGINVIDLVDFLERETGKIRVDLVNPGWLIFSPGFRASRLRGITKRVLDVLASSVLFFFSWPIMLVVALAIKIEDGISAPVFYQQCRVGKSGERFNVLKFRSMHVNAEADGKPKWAVKDDDRITRVGNFLRNNRLDELPQILNVLRGQMSLVGPRPERPAFVSDLQNHIPFYGERHTVKPGITGWAQLKYSYGASEEDAVEKLQYDLYYIKNQSLLLDILILLQTVEVVLWGKGAR
jgi:sugar transferase (PEP-CTERM system associated)